MKASSKNMEKVVLVIKNGGIDIPHMEIEHRVNIRMVKPYDKGYKYNSPKAKALLQEVGAEKFLIL